MPMNWKTDANEPRPKKYQMVIMTDEGKCYFVGKLYDFDYIHDAVKEMRELYEKHGITHHVGYREV